MTRCALKAGHGGRHMMIETTIRPEDEILGECRGGLTDHETHRRDTHQLLGSASHLLRTLSADDGFDKSIPLRMAREWGAAYARYRRGELAELPWMPAPPAVAS